VSAYVAGLQGDDCATDRRHAEHFCGYSGSEGGRNFAPLHAGPREFADVFLLPFEMAVKSAGAKSVMNAYIDVDGMPCAASRALLTRCCASAGASTASSSPTTSRSDAAPAPPRAEGPSSRPRPRCAPGSDVELPTSECYAKGIGRSARRGLLDLATLDEAAARVLRLKFALGSSKRRTPISMRSNSIARASAHSAREVAEKSIVLLANDGVLPLAASLRRVAVIGPNAADPMALFGTTRSRITSRRIFPKHPSRGRDRARRAARATRPGRVAYAEGCQICAHRDS